VCGGGDAGPSYGDGGVTSGGLSGNCSCRAAGAPRGSIAWLALIALAWLLKRRPRVVLPSRETRTF
jgi:MYXO-CTERM domain-containing protein